MKEFIKKQTRTSKHTSINTSKLPAVYNKVDWSKYSKDCYIFDIGCGCLETQSLARSKVNGNGLHHFYPWDPCHPCICHPDVAENLMWRCDSLSKVIICSNVLNVLDTDAAVYDLVGRLCDIIIVKNDAGTYRMNPCYITVYEGDKSGIGRETKKDCWQRNERLDKYLDWFNRVSRNRCGADLFKIKYGMIVGVTQYPKKVK